MPQKKGDSLESSVRGRPAEAAPVEVKFRCAAAAV
jgi:hypothetical protein